MKLDFDERFQENIVRLLHQDHGFAEAALDHLKHTAFENPVHAWTVRQMKQHLVNNGSMPDALVLKQERRKAEALGTIRKEDSPAYRAFLSKKLAKPVPNRTYIKKELQDFIVNQEWKSFILEAVDKLLPKKSFDDIKARAHRIIDTDITGDYSLGSRPGATFMKRVREREVEQAKGITTGIDELDRLMTRGGLTEKQLGVCLAPTGRGKTNFLINLAASAVLEGIPTLYVTLELDEDTIQTRMDARFTNIPLRMLKANKALVIKAWKKVRKRVRRNLIVKEFTPDTTVSQIRQHLKRLERNAFYPKLIVIDYADLLLPSVVFTDNSYETQGQVYRDLIKLLKEMKMVGWTATQGNRASLRTEAKGEVDMSMFSESIKKAMLAYVAVGIAQNEKEKKFNTGRLIVLKNRNGAADRQLKISIKHDVVSFKSTT